MEEVILYISCQREQRETVQIHKQFENNLLEKIKKLLTNTSECDNISELLKTTENIDNWTVNNLERFIRE